MNLLNCTLQLHHWRIIRSDSTNYLGKIISVNEHCVQPLTVLILLILGWQPLYLVGSVKWDWHLPRCFNRCGTDYLYTYYDYCCHIPVSSGIKLLIIDKCTISNSGLLDISSSQRKSKVTKDLEQSRNGS